MTSTAGHENGYPLDRNQVLYAPTLDLFCFDGGRRLGVLSAALRVCTSCLGARRQDPTTEMHATAELTVAVADSISAMSLRAWQSWHPGHDLWFQVSTFKSLRHAIDCGAQLHTH